MTFQIKGHQLKIHQKVAEIASGVLTVYFATLLVIGNNMCVSVQEDVSVSVCTYNLHFKVRHFKEEWVPYSPLTMNCLLRVKRQKDVCNISDE